MNTMSRLEAAGASASSGRPGSILRLVSYLSTLTTTLALARRAVCYATMMLCLPGVMTRHLIDANAASSRACRLISSCNALVLNTACRSGIVCSFLRPAPYSSLGEPPRNV